MERLLMQELCKWKDKQNHKPLLLNGARQVGKTWLMKEFGHRYYKNVVYINFDNRESLKSVFAMDYDTDRIISALRIECGKAFTAEDTLLIFDELQEIPRALASLKYFCENAPEYHIIAAGSLMGIALHEGTSFPVGKVELLEVHPLSFKEFLYAVNEAGLADAIQQRNFSLLNAFSDKLSHWLRLYYYIGGMPEAVQCYINTDDLKEVRKIQKNLLQFYENDFSKHIPKDQFPRVQMVWRSLPAQLAKENRKFIYGLVREGARAKDYELAIEWLQAYGLIHKSIRVSKPGLPLISYAEQNSFKLFLLDTGLLAAMGDIPAKVLLEGNRIFTEFKGALTEQFAAQELIVAGKTLYYYSTSNSSAEIDFIIQCGENIIPLEVKAEENLRAKSLRVFCQKYAPQIALRSSLSGYREEDWLTNVHLYSLAEYISTLEDSIF